MESHDSITPESVQPRSDSTSPGGAPDAPARHRRDIELDSLRPGDHLCCLYNTEEQHRALVTPFVRMGLENGEKVFYIVDERTAETVLGYLRADGLDYERHLKNGRLKILSAHESYVAGGVFDPDAMIKMLKSEEQNAAQEGFKGLRVTGEMTWALRDLPGTDRLIEYEAKLNEFLPTSTITAICQYDMRRFEAGILLDVLATHPFAVIGTDVLENFFYVPPKEFLGSNRARAMLTRWINNLRVRKQSEQDLKKSREELQEQAAQIVEIMSRLEAESTERRRTQEDMQHVSDSLNLRVRVLNCLRSMDEPASRTDLSGPALMEELIRIIPGTTHDEKRAFARITRGACSAETGRFSEDAITWSIPLVEQGEETGRLEVGFNRDPSDTGDVDRKLLEEERQILGIIAARIGRIMENHELQRELVRENDYSDTDLAELECLMPCLSTEISGRLYGMARLGDSVPARFERLVRRFTELVDLGMEIKTYKVPDTRPEKIRALADEMGALNSGPRDVVQILTAALKQKTARLNKSKAHAYLDEGRMIALELMGFLVSYYQNRASGFYSNPIGESRSAGEGKESRDA